MSTMEDSIYLNLKDERKQQEVDLDVLYNIGMIREITFDIKGGVFYILCNQYNEKLGVYILAFQED